ncbi:50S ribosomal protein L5 [Candidatus Mycoplasma haematominutum]|uniref:Large ribosomal subunit protein uL5 n=1 Tax=Candidatus Mycoplasma haematominutum 'Birmingham 1' TaxID=1116213 RepID=G8C327_9MOLU|nr:50S ribosomal protein L5 [Candidatus Mycoplasma haematominutum]CCE66725.1 ribosomal protein L5 [Candidatus Mycoplasma haematominutum 'Birmingham 1']
MSDFSWSLREKYRTEIISSLMREFEFSSPMQVPRLQKIVINIGCGDGSKDKQFIESSARELELIVAQKPLITKSKASIAEFKLREGQPVGLKVTLRNDRMWSFAEKFFKVALPRARDFKGIRRSAVDSQGNLNIGVKEQIIFTELNYDKVKKLRGMNISFVTSNSNREASLAMFAQLGCPFARG